MRSQANLTTLLKVLRFLLPTLTSCLGDNRSILFLEWGSQRQEVRRIPPPGDTFLKGPQVVMTTEDTLYAVTSCPRQRPLGGVAIRRHDTPSPSLSLQVSAASAHGKPTLLPVVAMRQEVDRNLPEGTENAP